MQFKLLNNLIKLFPLKQRQMALFKQVLNPITGQNDWEVRDDESYDYHQEVANAGFGDMLHDWERNKKYFAALRKTISEMHAAGREVNVLDIGTGTGILAMMAVAAGADSVVACEAFLPMANCAEKILHANGMANKVQLVKKRSTELKVGEDMPQRANLLVTEVLDTELIGEGAIGIYNHAHDSLLSDDVICIPAKASCYAQIVQTPLAAQWNTMKCLPNLDGDILLKTPKDVHECKGEAALHDVQVSQLPIEQMRLITEPLLIFEFDFNSKAARNTHRQRNMLVKSLNAGSTDLVLYWWDIKMDLAGDILLSCAPFWAHPEFKELSVKKSNHLPLSNVVPWRDHWMQAVYYVPKPLKLTAANEEFTLNCNHDEYSLWFDAFAAAAVKETPRHACTCSLHMTYARSRLGQMNQTLRNKRFMRYLEDNIQKQQSQVLVLGDGCLLGLAAAKLGASQVICYEPHRYSRRFMESIVQHNQLEHVQFIDKLDSLHDVVEISKLTHIFAEPYFLTSILPWDNFYFGTLLLKIKEALSPEVQVAPHSARIFALPVEFLDLHKIRTPIGSCEGFDLSLFDKMVESSTSLAQANVEAQPLWEYPCRALAQPQEILNVVFRQFDENKLQEGTINIEIDGTCNGIALWVDWHIDESNNTKSIVSTGPTEPVEIGQFVKWDMFVRQGVQLIGKAQQMHKGQSKVQWKIDFKPKAGQMKFNFDLLA